MRKGSTARFVNGVISAFIVVFFVAHSLLGGLEAFIPLESPLAFAVWIGVAVIVLHVATSVVTSYLQITDAQFPPSRRKKRHLVLKWVSGGVLGAIAIAHIACIRAFGPDAVQASAISTLLTLALIITLAVHSWIGAKSLVTDLGLDKRLMYPFRALVCAVAIVLGCFVIAGAVWLT